MSLYAQALQSIPPHEIDHFRSTLYILMSYKSMPLVRAFAQHGGQYTQVRDANTGLYWYCIPWGYIPYWQRHMRFICENFAWEFIRRNEHTAGLQNWSDLHFQRTFLPMKLPPHQNLYPYIRSAIRSILEPYLYEPLALPDC